MELRDYQLAAVDACRDAMQEHNKILVVAGTGSGKSIMIAEICRLAAVKGNRVLVLCAMGEILQQNEECLNTLAPDISTGIYCAGRGRKETKESVIFASRDSLAKKPNVCGRFSIIIVDESHLIDVKDSTQYQKIFMAIGPKYILGFSATPWRLGGGNIWGDKGYFDVLAYNICLNLLVERGYLSPYRFADILPCIDTKNVRVSSTGDFVVNELELVSATDEVVDQAIETWENQKSDRKCSIFFCCSIVHAQLVYEKLKAKGYATGYVDGKSRKKDRDELMRDAKFNQFDCLVNVGVLTTGVDIPVIDCVVMLRATKSAALFIQSIGRGLRVCEGKKDLLIMDFTDNLNRFGPDLSKPFVREDRRQGESTGTGDAIMKKCPSCTVETPGATSVCRYCGHIFINHTATPYGRIPENGIVKVVAHTCYPSFTNAGEACYVAEFDIGGRIRIKQWYLHQRDGFLGDRAKRFLKQLDGDIDRIKVSDIGKPFPRVDKIYAKGGL